MTKSAAPKPDKKPARKTPPTKKPTNKASVSPEESARLKKTLLDAMLKQVPDDGWTEEALLKGAQALGLDPLIVWALFPDKEVDALRTWSRFLDHQTTEKLESMDLKEMKIRMRIFWGVKTRLSLLTEHKKAASKAFRFLLNPKHSLLSTTLVYETVHSIWKTAGDTSTDYNFYTKRFLLAGVYVSTFVYWLKDTSPEHHDTSKFLEARIENVLMLQKAKDLKAFVPSVLSPLKSVFKTFWPPKSS